MIDFTGSLCDSGWFEVNDSCFRVFAGTSIAREWNWARSSCKRLGSDLAVVDSEIKRKIIAEHLTNVSNKYPDDNIKAFVGIRKFGTWHWLDDSNISTSILGIPILCGVESVACFLNGGFHKNGSSSRCLVLVGIQLDSSVKQMNVSPSLS